MITNKNYKTIKELESTNPLAHAAITETADEHLKSLAFASHEIKNMISFMNSSYQLISKQHPETGDFRFWKEFGDNINHLITFMDRTSTYRYCMKTNLEPINLMDIIYCLPDEADNRHPETSRNFNLDIEPSLSEAVYILAHQEHLQVALNEIIDNCYDATTSEDDTITITVNCKDISDSNIHIAISNPGTFPDIESTESVCKPFYTTKSGRVGLGLSIAYTVCTNHNGSLWLEQTDNESTVHISIPRYQS